MVIFKNYVLNIIKNLQQVSEGGGCPIALRGQSLWNDSCVWLHDFTPTTIMDCRDGVGRASKPTLNTLNMASCWSVCIVQ